MRKICVANLGILDGDEKRCLENYCGSEAFRQRKSFDEYYVDISDFNFDVSINDLMVLAEQFTVIVCTDEIEIKFR